MRTGLRWRLHQGDDWNHFVVDRARYDDRPDEIESHLGEGGNPLGVHLGESGNLLAVHRDESGNPLGAHLDVELLIPHDDSPMLRGDFPILCDDLPILRDDFPALPDELRRSDVFFSL